MNGPIVVRLNAPTDGSSSGCGAISWALSIQLREHPGRYYVDVSNKPFRFGAIRGSSKGSRRALCNIVTSTHTPAWVAPAYSSCSREVRVFIADSSSPAKILGYSYGK